MRIKLFENFDVLSERVRDFIRLYNGRAGSVEWGGTLDELRAENGNCAMISMTLCDYLEKFGIKCDTVTRELKHFRKEGFGDDGTHHTAVLVDDIVVDLTFSQFDKNAEFPLIIPLTEWEPLL